MTILCANCASELPEGTASCPQCGTLADGPAPDATDPLASLAAAPLFSSPFGTDQHLSGLSGWLVLVGFGLVVSPFLILRTLLSVNLPFLYESKYQVFLDGHRAVYGLLVFEVITNIIFLFAVISLNFLFFTKKKSFPTFMILFLASQALVLLLDAGMTLSLLPSADLTSGYGQIARPIGAALIWIPYFLVSRRVKATFVC